MSSRVSAYLTALSRYLCRPGRAPAGAAPTGAGLSAALRMAFRTALVRGGVVSFSVALGLGLALPEEGVSQTSTTPDGGSKVVAQNGTGHTVSFSVSYEGEGGGALHSFHCSDTGNVTCTDVSPTSATVTGDPTDVTVTFSSGSPDTNAKITLNATDESEGGGGGDTGYYDVRVNDPPTASASASPDTVKRYESVSFSSSGSGDTDGTITYDWDFGDNSSSTAANPSHAYSTRCTDFNPDLTVTDNDGATDSDPTDEIHVNCLPTADASTPVEPMAGDTSNLVGTSSTDSDGSITEYYWSFGDNSSAYGSSVDHVYAEPGSYSGYLRVKDDMNETDTDPFTVNVLDHPTVAVVDSLSPDRVNPADTADLSFDVTNHTPGAETYVVFECGPNSDNVTVIGACGDSIVFGNEDAWATKSYSFSVVGEASDPGVTVPLGVQNGEGSLTGTGYHTVAVNYPPVAVLADPPDAIESHPVSLDGEASSDPDDDPAALTYIWDYGDGTVDTTTATPSHTYTAGDTTYTVTLTVEDSLGLSDVDSKPIDVLPPSYAVAVGPAVTPVTDSVSTDTLALDFTVRNVGSEDAVTYSITPGCDGFVVRDCAADSTQVTLDAGAQRTVAASYAVARPDTGDVTLTAEYVNDASYADAGTATVIGEGDAFVGLAEITSPGGRAQATGDTVASPFTVVNVDTVSHTFALSGRASDTTVARALAVVDTAGQALDSVTLASGDTAHVGVRTEGAATGQASMLLDASVAGEPEGTGLQVTVVTDDLVAVVPAELRRGATADSAGQERTFWAWNLDSVNRSFTGSCIAHGPVSCVSVSPSGAQTIAPDTSVAFTVTFDAGEPGLGDVHLRSQELEEVAYAQGRYLLEVGERASWLWTSTDSTTVDRKHDRGLCVSTGAGPGAAFQCGDLVVSHGFPGYTSLNEERSVALVYSSRTAKPVQTVPVDLVFREDEPLADSVRFELDVTTVDTTGSVEVARHFAPPAPPHAQVTHRAVVVWDATGQGTGAYPYELDVTRIYPDSTFTETLQGTLLVVDRSGAPYGAGWTVGGTMRLHEQSDSSLVLVRSDGSAEHWTDAGGGSYAAPPGVYASLATAEGGWEWTSRGGLTTVGFDSTGVMTSVADLSGNTATYAWTSTANGPAVDSIVDAGGLTVDFDYASGVLDQLEVPGYAAFGVTVDGSGDLTTVTDPDGLATSYGYDGSGRMTNRAPRSLGSWTYTYDAASRLEEIARPLPLGTLFLQARASVGAPASGTGTSSSPATLGHADSAWVSATNGAGDETRFVVERHGAPVGILLPAAGGGFDTLTVERDSLAFATRIEWPSGREVLQSWNTGDGTLTSTVEVARDSATTSYAYDATFKLPTKVTPPTGDSMATHYAYDSAGRLSEVWNALGDTTAFAYNSKGLVTSVTRPLDTTATAFYYHDGQATAEAATWNLAGIVGPVADTTSFHYDSNGAQLDSLVDPSGLRTVYRKDAIGRDTATVQRTGSTEATTRFTYDDSLRFRERIGPEGVRHAWKENAAGLVSKRCTGTVSAGDCTAVSYDGAGRRQHVTNRAGQQIWLDYDGRGQMVERLTARPVPSMGNHTMTVDTATFTYDEDGNLTQAMNAYSVVTRTYNADGTLRYEKLGIDAWSGPTLTKDTHTTWACYGYDADGRVRKIARHGISSIGCEDTANDSIYIDRDARGITTVGRTEDPAREFSVTLDAHGRRTKLEAVTGSWTFSENTLYDDRDLIRRHTSTAVGDTFSYDVLGLKDTHNGKSFTYDDLHRLTRSQIGDTDERFAYDLAGNRTLRSEQLADDSVTFSYTTKGRLNAATDEKNACSTDYGYDAEGRRTGSTSTCTPEPVHSFTYTAASKLLEHLKSYDGDGGVTIDEDRLYWHDALGRRILMHSPGDSATDYGTWRYVWSQQGKLLQVTRADPTNPDSVIAQPTVYLPGTKPNELFGAIDNVAGTEKIYVHDAFGNVRSSRDSTGAAVETTGYTAYGVTGDGDDQQEASGFAGGLGAGDLVQFHNRYYDPLTGQFTTEDPIGFAGGSNLYSYAHSNPVNFSDPYGLVCFTPPTAALCLLTGAAVGSLIASAGLADQADRAELGDLVDQALARGGSGRWRRIIAGTLVIGGAAVAGDVVDAGERAWQYVKDAVRQKKTEKELEEQRKDEDRPEQEPPEENGSGN